MIDLQPTTFYSGTSGLVLPVSQSLYPAAFRGKSRLSYYASLFNSVEINSSFYKLPRVSTIIKWAESVPDNFRFTFKLSKAITHVKALNFNKEDVEVFMQTIDNVDAKKGCVLVQLPPSLHPDKISRLENLLINIQNVNYNKWQVAVEFRNKRWYNAEVYDLLKQYNVSLVIHDLPASAAPLTASTASFMYLRFHGTAAGYRGSYADDFLFQYAQHIKLWMGESKSVYFYFNNTLGDAFKNLQKLNEFLL